MSRKLGAIQSAWRHKVTGYYISTFGPNRNPILGPDEFEFEVSEPGTYAVLAVTEDYPTSYAYKLEVQ